MEPSPAVGDLRRRKHCCALLARAMTVGRTVGLIGAVLLAPSPFHLRYSAGSADVFAAGARRDFYAATCFHYLRAPSLPRGAWVSLAGLALVYSHPYGLSTQDVRLAGIERLLRWLRGLSTVTSALEIAALDFQRRPRLLAQ